MDASLQRLLPRVQLFSLPLSLCLLAYSTPSHSLPLFAFLLSSLLSQVQSSELRPSTLPSYFMQSYHYSATYSEHTHDDAHLAHTASSTPTDSPPREVFSNDGHGCVASIHTFGASPASTFSSALGSPFDDHTMRLAEPSSSATNTPQIKSHHPQLAPSSSFLDMHPSPSTQGVSLPGTSPDSREAQASSLSGEVSAKPLLLTAKAGPLMQPPSQSQALFEEVQKCMLYKSMVAPGWTDMMILSSSQPWSISKKHASILSTTASIGSESTGSFSESIKRA